MDRGYLDFARLFTLDQANAFFVTRAKRNFNYRRRYSRPVDKATGLICDQTVVPATDATSHAYPEPLRRIRYNDPKTGKALVFLANHFGLTAPHSSLDIQGPISGGLHAPGQ